MKKLLFILLATSFVVCCSARHRRGEDKPSFRTLSPIETPYMIEDQVQRCEYLADRLWKEFFSGEGRTDTAMILGVRRREVEERLSFFITLLDQMPMATARKKIDTLFSCIEKKQALDTSNHVFVAMTDMVSKYLYDPNSPLRCEDYYLPFVTRLSQSAFSLEEARPGYEFEVRMCSLNQYGEKVPDFSFKDVSGRIRSLSGIKADYTVLFFSNPGCHSCKEIVDEMKSCGQLEGLIASGNIAVLNLYVDSELEKWRTSLQDYPSSWMNCYDHRSLIRESDMFNLRAIPSLYLLDSEKKVLLKDVPFQRIVNYFNRRANKNNIQ